MREGFLKYLAGLSLEIQDACNSGALVHTFSKVMTRMGMSEMGTTERNTHPVTILFLDKLNSLAGIQELGNDAVSQAYDWAYRMREKEVSVDPCPVCGEDLNHPSQQRLDYQHVSYKSNGSLGCKMERIE